MPAAKKLIAPAKKKPAAPKSLSSGVAPVASRKQSATIGRPGRPMSPLPAAPVGSRKRSATIGRPGRPLSPLPAAPVASRKSVKSVKAVQPKMGAAKLTVALVALVAAGITIAVLTNPNFKANASGVITDTLARIKKGVWKADASDSHPNTALKTAESSYIKRVYDTVKLQVTNFSFSELLASFVNLGKSYGTGFMEYVKSMFAKAKVSLPNDVGKVCAVAGPRGFWAPGNYPMTLPLGVCPPKGLM